MTALLYPLSAPSLRLQACKQLSVLGGGVLGSKVDTLREWLIAKMKIFPLHTHISLSAALDFGSEGKHCH